MRFSQKRRTSVRAAIDSDLAGSGILVVDQVLPETCTREYDRGRIEGHNDVRGRDKVVKAVNLRGTGT